MKVIVALVAILAIASATETTQEALARLHAQPLGHALLMSIKTNIDAGQTVDEVSQFLHQMLSDAQTYSSDLDTAHNTTVTSYNTKIAAQVELIRNYKTAIDKLVDTIANNKRTLEIKEGLLKQAKKQLADATKELSDVEKEHARVAPQLQKDVDAATEAEAACREAIAHMETYQSAIGASLLEVAASSESMLMAFSKHLEQLKPHLISKNTETSALIHELIALTAAPKETKSEKVLRLLKELLVIIRTELADSKAAQAHEQKTYEENVDRLTAEINRLKGEVRTLTEEVANLKTKIKADEEQLTITRDNLKTAEELKKQFEEELAREKAAYKYNRAKCDKEIKIMRELINHFDSSVKDVSAYTKTAIHTGKGKF